MQWQGVMPAITTPFDESLEVDHDFLGKHASWLVDHGATAIVALGSLGEGATLEHDEKIAILRTCVEACAGRVPVVAAVSALSTSTAQRIAADAKDAGCGGLMVLPPYVHNGQWHEIRAHFSGVLGSTDLPCMIYNNPIAYGTDLRAEHIAELKSMHAHVQAVKESSGDVRRVTALRAELGDDFALFAGLDDMIVEAVAMGAVGWIAGLVNAMPVESVRVFELAREGKSEEAFELYRWFLPLLRLDTVPEFVQLIKLVQKELGIGSERVRLPRLPVEGELRQQALEIIGTALANRPSHDTASFA